MCLDNGKCFPRLGTNCGLLAVNNRDCPPDLVHGAEMEQSTPDDLQITYSSQVSLRKHMLSSCCSCADT